MPRPIVASACSIGRVIALFGFGLSPAFAQVSAELSGTVTDQTGAGVPSARVTARNLDIGVERTGMTDSSGHYEFSALALGRYEVLVIKLGFKAELRTGIDLAVGQDAEVCFRLQVGEANQQITVTDDAAIASATTADTSGLAGRQQVRTLPLNGRSYDLLVTLNPGVVNYTSQK